MPNLFPCPNCGADVITWMRSGEAATCANCDTSSVVPEDAVPTDEHLPPPAPPSGSVTKIRRTGLRRSNLDARVSLGIWGGVVICLAVVSAIAGLIGIKVPEDGWGWVAFLWAPFLLLGGIGLLMAGRVVTALNGIRDEIKRNSRADRDRPVG